MSDRMVTHRPPGLGVQRMLTTALPRLRQTSSWFPAVALPVVLTTVLKALWV